jgi:hypothetical protein
MAICCVWFATPVEPTAFLYQQKTSEEGVEYLASLAHDHTVP